MNEETLFEAIGAVENRFLEELEDPPVRHLPKHFGLIAALIALLLTACAAPAVIRSFDKLQRVEISQSKADIVWNSPYFEGVGFRVFMEKSVSMTIQRAEDAPVTIEQRYIPEKLLEYRAITGGTNSEAMFSLDFAGESKRYGALDDIRYRQYVIPNSGEIEIEDFVGAGMWDQVSVEYGEIRAVSIYGDPVYENSEQAANGKVVLLARPVNHLFWSDGYYLYCLRYPTWLNLDHAELEEILNSLTAVDDLSQYLPEQE